jgi:DNA-binding CsgD family transcriptional regulator
MGIVTAENATMRHASPGGSAPNARVFERLVRDAQCASDLAAFRSKILETLALEIGADSATLMDAPGARLTPERARSRIGMLFVDPGVLVLYVSNKRRYERSAERLLRAMATGAPVIDSQVYGQCERERLDLYAEVLRPQGTRSMLCANVHRRGRAHCQLNLKRHGRGTPFRERDAESLALLLPALALADAGFQHSPALSPRDDDSAPLCVGTRPLGSREAEVAALVSKGMRNREIAMLTGTSCSTVKKQVRNVFAKVGVSNRAELAGLFAGHRGS